MILLAPPTAAPPSPAQLLEGIIAAHRRLLNFEVRIDHPLPKGARGTIPSPKIGRSGDQITLQVLDPTARPLPTVRTFFVDGDRRGAYDDVLNEVVTMGPTNGSAPSRLFAIMGASDLTITFILEPNTLAALLRALAPRKGWKVAGNSLILNEAGSRTVIGYDPKTMLLTRISRQRGRDSLEARYDYSANGLRKWVTPPGARQVAFASTLVGALRFADGRSRIVTERMVRRNGRLTPVRVAIAGDNPAVVEGHAGDIRQLGSKFEVIYAGRVLSVRNLRTGHLMRGSATRQDVRRIAAQVGEPLVPVAQAMLSNRLPFANLFVPPRLARVKGEIVVGGQPCDILDLTSDEVRTTLFVDRTGRITSLEAESKEKGGRTVTRSRQRFTYIPLAGPIRVATGPAEGLPPGRSRGY